MRLRAIIVLILILLTAGCMLRTGTVSLEKENPETISQKIKVGETTREDIQKEFGNPRSYSTAASGNQTWIYQFAGQNWFFLSPSLKQKTLYVTFDRAGKVIDYHLNETNW